MATNNFYNPSYFPRYRTIKECLAEIKSLDPQTAVSEFLIRQLCKQKKVKYIPSGNKSLVSLDDLLNFLGYSRFQDFAEKQLLYGNTQCRARGNLELHYLNQTT